MRFKRVVTILLLIAAALATLLSAGAVGAADSAVLTLTLPEQATVGEEATLQVRLARENGLPIAGATIEFFRNVEFANVTGDLKLGEAVTDSLGIAALPFGPRSFGEQKVVARFAGDGAFAAAEASSFLLIAPGPQMHTEHAGINIPFLGPWFLAVVLGTIWGLFGFVAVQLLRTAHAGTKSLPYWEKR